MTERRLLARLDRRIGGIRAGSASFVYQMGPRGHRLLRAGGDGLARRRYEPGLGFLEHHLEIADLHVSLSLAERRGEVKIAALQLEPQCWRAYSNLTGQTLWLRPDLYVALAAGDDVTHWFVEIDRGTESIQTLIRKCRAYEDYLRSGREQGRIGAFPYVCWSLTRAGRLEQFRAALVRAKDLTVEAHQLVLASEAAEHLVDLSRPQ
jgi:hypothetical protein